MATQTTVDQAVLHAAETAQVNREAADGARVVFDPAALERVRSLYSRPGSQDLVIRAWHRTLREAIAERGDIDLGLALAVLQERLRGSRGVEYEVTETGMQLRPAVDTPIDQDPWYADRNYHR